MTRIETIAAAIALLALPVAASATDPETAQTNAATSAEAPPHSADAGSVARAQVTTAVVDREPQDSVDRVTGDVTSLAYFTELHGLKGQTVTHVWEHQGNEMARVSFPVGAPRWRVHSTKRLDASWVGAWRVSVVDQSGAELRSDHFYYAAEDAATDGAPPAAAE